MSGSHYHIGPELRRRLERLSGVRFRGDQLPVDSVARYLYESEIRYAVERIEKLRAALATAESASHRNHLEVLICAAEQTRQSIESEFLQFERT